MTELLPYEAERFLEIGVGLFWSLTYLLVIEKGFRDRAVGIPFAALCANFMWEFTFALLYPYENVQQIITFIWFALGIIIVLQFFLYAKPHHYFNRKGLLFFSALLVSFLLILGITIEFKDLTGKYSAFAINLMMSILFIRMMPAQGLLGQSQAIAYTKMMGSVMASILFYTLFPHSVLLNLMYLLILIFDVVYIFQIHRHRVTSA